MSYPAGATFHIYIAFYLFRKAESDVGVKELAQEPNSEIIQTGDFPTSWITGWPFLYSWPTLWIEYFIYAFLNKDKYINI